LSRDNHFRSLGLPLVVAFLSDRSMATLLPLMLMMMNNSPLPPIEAKVVC